MGYTSNRRAFLKTVLAGTAALNLPLAQAGPSAPSSFSFILLGDLHFDRLEHHDLEWLQKEKPDDVRQVRDYARKTKEILPRLFATIRETILDLKRSQATTPAFTLQVGDLVEGLCGNETLAVRHNTEALEFIRDARLGVPFLFTKGNHDITGPGAVDAYRNVFHPFLAKETAGFKNSGKQDSARYYVEHGNALFCFFDAYDRESLPWLEAALANRTAEHCFVVVHPPVVPYGARSTWHVFPSEHERPQRERLLEILGKHRAFVLGGHIHKYNVLTRTTPGGGQFVQLALSSIISEPEGSPKHLLNGVSDYTPDQVKVEPEFSPASEKERRAVYQAEAPLVKDFQYADQPGYAVVSVNGSRVSARIFPRLSRQVWRTVELSDMLRA